MKSFFNPLIKLLVKSSLGWAFAKLFIRGAEWFRYERSKFDQVKAEEKLIDYFKDLTVMDGYFVGLKYPSFSSFGSSLFPKLSGSYESELFPFFKEMETRNYHSIMDVGCAEGFYAIGFAIKHPNAKIQAFDIEPQARLLCKEMAVFNNVEQNIIISEGCSPDYLKTIDANESTFIICDCEGYERKLFNKDNIQFLKNADVLVELHPMYEKDVKEFLFDLFGQTHNLRIISSYDDNRKLFDLPKKYNALSKFERQLLVTEGRSFSMDWLIAIPKDN